MARANPTFSSADLIRYWLTNLEREEQEEVRCFFLLFERAKRAPLNVRLPRIILEFLASLLPIINLIPKLVEVLDELKTADECLRILRRMGPGPELGG